MRSLLKTFLVVLILTGSFVVKAGDGRRSSHTSNKSLFVYKTEKKFVGATVEVLYSNGDLLTAQVLQQRKIIIDFRGAESGTYTIRISKGNDVVERRYKKKK